MKKIASCRGFTIVELSIVLVIIGLLVGGILAAQSMMENARLKKLVRTVDQYLMATRNFQTKFNYLPGDEDRNGTVSTSGFGNIEGVYYFRDLSQFEMPSINWQNTGSSVPTPGVDVPRGIDSNTHFSILGFSADSHGAVTVVETFADYVADISVGIGSTYLSYSADCTVVIPGAPLDDRATCPTLTPQQALAIDAKIDDGMPNTGDFIANGGGAIGYSPSGSNGICSAGGPGQHGDAVAGIAYGQLTGKNCIPAWRVQ